MCRGPEAQEAMAYLWNGKTPSVTEACDYRKGMAGGEAEELWRHYTEKGLVWAS